MNPKDKALELCQKFGWLGVKWEQTDYTTLSLENAKQCALIAIDEVLKDDWFIEEEYCKQRKDYWEEVKTEIEKL